MVDATARPLRICADYSTYADQHEIFDLLSSLLQLLIIEKPRDPLTFLVDVLQNKERLDVFRIIILGPPGAGKHTLAYLLSTVFEMVIVEPIPTIRDFLVTELKAMPREERAAAASKYQHVNPVKASQAIAARLRQPDCVTRGWILPGFPKNRSQAIELAARGFFPRHVLFLDVPEDIALFRSSAKLVEMRMSDHPRHNLLSRYGSMASGNTTSANTILAPKFPKLYENFMRNKNGLLRFFEQVLRIIDANNSIEGVFGSVLDFIRLRSPSLAPYTPRMLLLGPPGCGKRELAAALSVKFDLVNLRCGDIIKQAVLRSNHPHSTSATGLSLSQEMTDREVMDVVQKRVQQRDCVTKGWIMRGFPRNVAQASLFHKAGLHPNRIVFMDLPDEVCEDRVLGRLVDPLTGDLYHEEFNRPTDPVVEARLLVHPKDHHARLKKRLDGYRSNAGALTAFYENAQHVDAQLDPFTTFEIVECILLRPNPRRLEAPIELLFAKDHTPTPSSPLLNYHLYHLDVDFVL